MSVGYSLHVRDLNSNADPASLGVELGKYCIDRNIPVTKVAAEFSVSRTTVYNWFCGVTAPHRHMHAHISSFMG